MVATEMEAAGVAKVGAAVAKRAMVVATVAMAEVDQAATALVVVPSA